MSDYIYRGVSLSQRKPSGGAYVEATWHEFYVGANVQSVDLPTNPAVGGHLAGGYRWRPGDFEFDLGANYFWYPGESLAEGRRRPATGNTRSTWSARSRAVPQPLTFKGQFAYSPNVSGTGAWGAYSEARRRDRPAEVPICPASSGN